MDPLFVGAAALMALVILTVAVTMRISRNRAQSLARVEALQALAAESGPSGPLARQPVRRSLSEGGSHGDVGSGPSVSPVSAEALAQAEVFGLSATSEFDDDWDLWLRAEDRDDTREYADADVEDYATGQDVVDQPAPAAVSIRTVATTPQFVVHVSDAGGVRRWQVSFQQNESES